MKRYVPGWMVRFLKDTPPLYIGGTLLNVLGVQFVRIFAQNIWRLRPRKVRPDLQKWADQLHEDGVVAIPNFLSASEFEEIKKEFDERYSRGQGGLPSSYSERFADYKNHIEEFNEYSESEAMRRNFIQSKDIAQIVCALSHRKMGKGFFAVFYSHRRRNLDKDAREVRTSHSVNFLHADVYYPSYKLFFYLNDVDERNGAFTYVPGSHKLTLKRLALEYRLGSLWKRGRPDGVISDEEAKELGFIEKPIVAPANTLVIFNVMGFHRRGDFHDLRPRQTVHMDFRALESLKNTLTTRLSPLLIK